MLDMDTREPTLPNALSSPVLQTSVTSYSKLTGEIVFVELNHLTTVSS